MNKPPQPAPGNPARRAGVSALGLSALGIVFGDIGTSPLYTLKTVLGMTSSAPTHDIVLGVLSLIVWTLIMITSVKYVIFAMSIDNDGEGGILALMSLLGIKKHKRPLIVALGLFGAALIYGDGAITPAISVLSALEGLKIATPDVEPYIVPAAVAILIGLFAIQPLGTARIGKTFRSAAVCRIPVGGFFPSPGAGQNDQEPAEPGRGGSPAAIAQPGGCASAGLERPGCSHLERNAKCGGELIGDCQDNPADRPAVVLAGQSSSCGISAAPRSHA